MRGFGLVVLSMMVALAGPAWAEETDKDKSDNVVMNEVVVTASREAEQVVDIPAQVTVIDAAEIARSNAQNVPEVLQSLAGVHITDIGGNKRNYNVDLRGFGESAQQNILLLVDGRRVNIPDLSGADWNAVPLDRIARIEVLRGSRGSVLYGDNATAGVINIITKEGGLPQADATVQYGSYDSFKGAGSVSGSQGIIGYDLSASYFESDGYRDNSAMESKDVGLNVNIDPTEDLRLNLSSGYHYDDTRNPGSLSESELTGGGERTDTSTPNDFDAIDDYYVKAGLELDMLSNDTFRLEYAYHFRDRESYGTYEGGWFSTGTETPMVVISPQLIFREDFEGVSNRIIMGADLTEAKQTYDSRASYGSINFSIHKKNRAFYIQDDLGVGDRVTLSGGYRSDRVIFGYDEASIEERTIDEGAYNAGINYKFSAGHLYVNYSHGFRYPVFEEQFSYFSGIVDPTIMPQVSDNYEIGGSARVHPTLTLRLNLFYLEIEDEIYFDSNTFANTNMTDKTLRQGVELGFDWRISNIDVGAAYYYTDTEIEGGAYDGNHLPAVPRDKVTARINYATGFGLSFGLNGVYVGESYLISDWNNEADKADAYTVVNAKVDYNWRNLDFFLNLNNIFNEEYSAYTSYSVFTGQTNYYPSPEFNFLLGVSARFGG